MWSNHSVQQHIENDSQINPSEPVTAPHFDEEAIRQAKPAVPLAKAIAGRYKPGTLIAVGILAALVGGIIGSLVPVKQQNHPLETQIDTAQTPPSQSQSDIQTDKGNIVSKATDLEPSSATENQQNQPIINESETAVDKDEAHMPPTSPETVRQPVQYKEELRNAFSAWVKAQKNGDIQGQMGFYPATVTAFYRWRGATRENVRAEKSRVFGRATAIHIEAGEPDIKMNPDGQQATLRFRKRYRIEGPGGDRNGEVLQELRWQRIHSKWQIVSERDVKVLRQS